MMDRTGQANDKAPARYAALTRATRATAEALDALANLHATTTTLGKVLVEAGLSRRDWRSDKSSLNLLSPALPAITIGAFLARLERFATHDGQTWLHGDYDDLAAFREEVAILVGVTRTLRDVVYRLQHLPVEMPGGSRGDHSFQRVVRHPQLQAPLEIIAGIVSDLDGLSPSMRPLSPEQWRAIRRAAGPFPARMLGVVTTWLTRLRGAPQSPSIADGDSAEVRSLAGAGGARALLPFSWLRRWPPRQRWLLAAGLLVAFVAVFAALAYSRQPHPPSSSPALSSAVRSVLPDSGTATILTTVSPATSATPAPVAPKLTLTCSVRGATGTVTLKNVGTSSFTWQAQPPQNLTISPTQGALQAGQSATIQVSAANKKAPSGTITVIAKRGAVSTEDKVTCRAGG
jgi:hypothetical protein